MSSLAKEFERLLNEHGHFTVGMKRSFTQKCPICVGDQPDSDCPWCLGWGMRVSAFPLLAADSVAEKAPDEQQDTPFGISGTNTKRFYIHPKDALREIDNIAVVTWSVPKEQMMTLTGGAYTTQPISYRVVRTHLPMYNGTIPIPKVLAVHRVYEVNHVDPYYGETGELAYYRVLCKDADINTSRTRDFLLSDRVLPQGT